MKENDKKEDGKNFTMGCLTMILIIGVIIFAFHSCSKANNKTQQVNQSNQKIENNLDKPIYTEIENFSDITIKPLLSANGNNKIGKFGVAYYTGKITEKNLIKFYNICKKHKELNFVILINDNDKENGYMFNNTYQFIYGKIIKENNGSLCVKEGVKYYIENNRIKQYDK